MKDLLINLDPWAAGVAYQLARADVHNDRWTLTDLDGNVWTDAQKDALKKAVR